MQAIETRYIGPGNVRGARIVAECDAGRVVVSYDHAGHAHAKAALALLAKVGWDGGWIEGTTKRGSNVYVTMHVRASGQGPATIYDSAGNVLAQASAKRP